MDRLGQLALTSPQNAYASLTKGVQQKRLPLAFYTLHGRGSGQVEERLDRVIANIFGKEIIQGERELFSLPLRMGGLNIALPLLTPLASFNKDSIEIQQCELEQTKISLKQKADIQRERISKKSRIENNLPEMKYIIQLASEKGAAGWLNALPLSKHVFDLTKTEFREGVALRYTWEAKNTPAICICGKEFSLTMSFIAPKAAIRTYDTMKSETCLQT